MVAAYHLGYWWWIPVNGRSPFHPWTPLSFGWVGVEIFFVISGFVIAFSAQHKSRGEFIWHRALRLYPAAWICATITALIATPTSGSYLRTLALSPIGPWVSGVYWTLAIEIVFYTLVAISTDLHKLALWLGLYSSAFWAAKLVNLAIGQPIDFSAIETNAGYLLLLHFGVFFACGMMMWARKWTWAGVFGMVGLLEVLWRSHAMHEPFFYSAGIVWAIATLLIAASVRWNDHLGFTARTIGLMTYPLYLVHAELGRWVMLHFADQWIAFVAGIAAVVLTAWAVLPGERAIRSLAQFNRRP